MAALKEICGITVTFIPVPHYWLQATTFNDVERTMKAIQEAYAKASSIVADSVSLKLVDGRVTVEIYNKLVDKKLIRQGADPSAV